MNALFAGVIVVGSLFGAWRLTAGAMNDRLAGLLAGTTACFAIFLASFFVQGFAELAWHMPLIGLAPGALVVAAIVATSLFVRPKRSRVRAGTSDEWPDRGRPLRRLPLATAALVLVAFVVLAILLIAGLPRGYEVKAYHLPIAVRILRDGTLGLWDHAFMHAYPADMSVWAGFLLDLVPERVVAVADLPFLALLCAAVFASCRAVGADRSASVLAIAGLATIPIFGFSALEIGADIGGVAFIAVAAAMIVSTSQPPTARSIVAGVAAGIAFGFKSLELVPLGVLAVCLVLQCARDWRRRRSWRSFVPVAWFVLGALAMMSFWLVRNAVELGNPLYPVHVRGLFDLLGWRAAPDFVLASRTDNEHEWVARTRDWFVYPWVEGHVINQNFKHSSGLGAFFAATIPVVVVLWPLQRLTAWRTRTLDRFAPAQSVLYAVAAVVFVAWWVLGDRQPRYFAAAIVVLVPLAARLVTETTGRLRTAYEALLAVCVLTMTFVLLVRLGVENGPYLTTQRGATRAQMLGYPPAIDRLPPGAVVGNGYDREISYALLGSRLANRVVDSTQVLPRLETPDHALRLTKDDVAALGIDYLYVLGDRRLETDDCVTLHEVDRMDRNTLNGQPIAPARVLYAVDVCGAPAR